MGRKAANTFQSAFPERDNLLIHLFSIEQAIRDAQGNSYIKELYDPKMRRRLRLYCTESWRPIASVFLDEISSQYKERHHWLSKKHDLTKLNDIRATYEASNLINNNVEIDGNFSHIMASIDRLNYIEHSVWARSQLESMRVSGAYSRCFEHARAFIKSLQGRLKDRISNANLIDTICYILHVPAYGFYQSERDAELAKVILSFKSMEKIYEQTLYSYIFGHSIDHYMMAAEVRTRTGPKFVKTQHRFPKTIRSATKAYTAYKDRSGIGHSLFPYENALKGNALLETLFSGAGPSEKLVLFNKEPAVIIGDETKRAADGGSGEGAARLQLCLAEAYLHQDDGPDLGRADKAISSAFDYLVSSPMRIETAYARADLVLAQLEMHRQRVGIAIESANRAADVFDKHNASIRANNARALRDAWQQKRAL